ncbi:MAG: hypothetical protein JXR76_07125 [Deltaproteobacteria bacterium]|nr:hypothetical protein [Deltaproteobacteria bacterium]
MDKVFSPATLVLEKTRIIRVRKLPPDAAVQVTPGQVARAADVVATASVPGQVHSVAASDMLGVAKSKVVDYLLLKEGDPVTAGQALGEHTALLGLVKSQVVSPVDGIVETVSRVSGHVMIRENPHVENVRAFVSGQITGVDEKNGVTIEAEVSLVQGVFGVGGEVMGTLCLFDDTDVQGKIVCTKDTLTVGALNRFKEAGAKGVVAPSISGSDLYGFCGAHLNLAATGDEDVGLTLMITEGFGQIPMARRTRQVLLDCVGKHISMCGITQVRAGVIRPELIGPVIQREDDKMDDDQANTEFKIVRGPFAGEEARIVETLATPQVLPSGVKALVYRVRLVQSGDEVLVARANVAR